MINDKQFIKEYELPENPQQYTDSDKYVNDYLIEPLSQEEFLDQLETLKKNRANFKFE